MSDRVLSSEAAKSSIQKMQRIITGPLLDQITALNREGIVLEDRNNWDGRLAEEFRSKWPETHQALQKTQQALEDLRKNIEKINQNIMTAGGNA